jgi:hypothetical protein
LRRWRCSIGEDHRAQHLSADMQAHWLLLVVTIVLVIVAVVRWLWR